jgi:hypothetical protein
MENQFEEIIKRLDNLEGRVRELEGSASKGDQGEIAPPQTKNGPHKNRGENLFPPINKILEKGFFKDYRTDKDVCEKLKLDLLTKKRPLRASVVNVLRAMVKKDLLSREKIQIGKRQVLAYKQK